MKTENGPQLAGIPFVLAALAVASAQAAAPQQPVNGHSASAPAAAPKVQKQSSLGEWVGAPCRLIVQEDDGRNVTADCYTAGGLHHEFRARYTAPDLIEGTVTRIDPSGCRVAVPMTVHITDANHMEYTHPGFTGCGVNNAGPANAYPVRRAQPVSASATDTATARPTSTTANKTGTATSQSHANRAAQAETPTKANPAVKTAAAAPPTEKPTAPVKPVKPPVKVPVKAPAELPAKPGA